MELRSSYNFHYINAIKDGKATKTHNQFYGKPALKFKYVEDLYEVVENARHRPYARRRMKVLLQELPKPSNDGDEAKVENPRVIGGGKIRIKREKGVLNANCSHGERQVAEYHKDEDDLEMKVLLQELPKPSNDGDEAKVENPRVIGGGKIRIKREKGVLNANCSRGERQVAEYHKDEDDLEFFNLTLKQIKRRFVAKKRKRLSEESTLSCLSVESDHPLSKSEIDDSDMMESLHSWAARIVKNKKIKKNLKRNSNLTVVKSEGVPYCHESPCRSDSSLHAHVNVKVEVPECDNADCQAIVVSGMDSSCSSVDPLDSHIFPFNAEPGLSGECDGGILKTGDADCQAIAVDDMEDSYGLLVLSAPSGFAFDEQPCSNSECDVEMDTPAVSPDELVESKGLDFQSEESVTADDAFQPQTSNYFSKEPHCCSGKSEFQTKEFNTDSDDVFLPQTITYGNGLETCSTNEMSYKYLEEAGPQPSTPCANVPQCCSLHEESDKDFEHDVPLSSDDAKDLGVRVLVTDKVEGVVNQLATTLSLSQIQKVDLLVDSHQSDDLGESVSHSDHSQDDLSVSDGEKLQNNTSQFEITIKDSTGCMVDSCLPKGEVKDEKTYLETKLESCTSAVVEDQVEISCQNSCQNGSLSDNSSTDVGMESPLFSSVVSAKRKNSCADQPVQLVDGEDSLISEQEQPPERLLSTRKTISPTSQEKLRKAMEFNELDDEQLYKYARKLCYGKRTANTNSRLDGINQVKRAENTVSPQQLMRKLKYVKPNFPPNDIPKVARLVRGPQRFSTGCTSVQSCSENAITFTQNQMLDFESMTTKLVKELKSMKEMAESTLVFKVNPCTSPKYTHQQVSGAIEKATRMEETARRWISTMGRDCDRFCKLMKLVQKGSSTTSTQAVQKEKRKISFADEAGGELCHVKTFKSEAESIAEETIIVD
ncbi:hypothetical protein LINPERPRIM_LOCUS32747 [Linum perenne]